MGMIDWGRGGGVYKLMEEQGEKGTAGIPTELNLGGSERSIRTVGPMRRSEDEGCSGGDLQKCVCVWVCEARLGGFKGERIVLGKPGSGRSTGKN